MPTFQNHEKLGVVRALLNGNGMPKNEFRGAREPTPSDDLGQGWEIGSRWFFGNREWVCKSAAYGFAVWDLATGDAGVQAQLPPYTPFSSVSEIGVTSVPADLPQISAVINGLAIAWGRDPSGTLMSADGATWSPLGDVYPEHFGAVGDGSTDDTAACQAWADSLRKNGRAGRVSGKTYVVTHLEMMPEQYYSISGDNFHKSNFLIRNPNRTEVGINFGHEDGNTRVTPGVRLQDFRVQAEAGTKACLVQFARNSDIQTNRFKISGFHGATGLRSYGLWNCDHKEITVYGCGHNIPMKNVPAGATFAIANGSTTLTCSVDLFDASDVGRSITLTHPQNVGGQRHTITAVAGPRSATVSEVQTSMSHTASFGNYGGIRGSTTAGGNTLTLGSAENISADDIGRVVYIVGGMENPAGSGGYIPLRATITAVSGNVLTLDRTTPRTISWTELVFDPAVDMGDPDPTALNQKTNDTVFSDLHIELNRGCALVLNCTRASFPRIKLHGLNVTASSGNNNQATNIQALIYASDGEISGHFDQSVSGNWGRIVMQDMMGMTFPLIETLGIHRLPVLYTVGKATAPIYRSRIDVGTIQYYGNGSDQTMQGIIGEGWYNQYGTTSCSHKPGVAKQHGNPTLINSP